MKTLVAFIFLNLVARLTLAQTEAQIRTETSVRYKHEFNNFVGVNFIPLMGILSNSPGLGLGYQLKLNDHYAVGAGVYYRNYYRFKGQDVSDIIVEYINASMELRYKLSSFSESGFFAGFGTVVSGVRGSIHMENFIDYYNQQNLKAGAPQRWETILVPKIGYLVAPNVNGSYSDFSLSYEPIDEIEYSYGRNPNFFEINKRRVGVSFTYMLGFVF